MNKVGHKQNNDKAIIIEMAKVIGTQASKKEVYSYLKEHNVTASGALIRIWNKYSTAKENKSIAKENKSIAKENKSIAKESFADEITAFQDRCIANGKAHKDKQIPKSVWDTNPAVAFWTAVGQIMTDDELY